jgi:hypothetical protein
MGNLTKGALAAIIGSGIAAGVANDFDLNKPLKLNDFGYQEKRKPKSAVRKKNRVKNKARRKARRKNR